MTTKEHWVTELRKNKTQSSFLFLQIHLSRFYYIISFRCLLNRKILNSIDEWPLFCLCMIVRLCVWGGVCLCTCAVCVCLTVCVCEFWWTLKLIFQQIHYCDGLYVFQNIGKDYETASAIDLLSCVCELCRFVGIARGQTRWISTNMNRDRNFFLSL